MRINNEPTTDAPPPPATPDEVLLRRCLDYLIEQLGATGGELVRDLKERLK